MRDGIVEFSSKNLLDEMRRDATKKKNKKFQLGRFWPEVVSIEYPRSRFRG